MADTDLPEADASQQPVDDLLTALAKSIERAKRSAAATREQRGGADRA